MSYETSNPFNDNHVFTEKDFARNKPRFLDRLGFLFCPKLVQINQGYVFFYKINSSGEYLLLGYERINISTGSTKGTKWNQNVNQSYANTAIKTI